MALHYDGEVRIVKVNMGPFNNNGYIVSCPETNEGILIDTPAEPELLLNEVGDVSIKAILITHNHQDHLLGFDEITGSLDAPVGITTADKGPLPKAPDVELTDGQVIQFGNQELRVLVTPGTPTAQAASWWASICSPATRCSRRTGQEPQPGGAANHPGEHLVQAADPARRRGRLPRSRRRHHHRRGQAPPWRLRFQVPPHRPVRRRRLAGELGKPANRSAGALGWAPRPAGTEICRNSSEKGGPA